MPAIAIGIGLHLKRGAVEAIPGTTGGKAVVTRPGARYIVTQDGKRIITR